MNYVTLTEDIRAHNPNHKLSRAEKTNLRKTKILPYLSNVFKECQNLQELEDCKNAVKLALKTIQEGMNAGGVKAGKRTDYFPLCSHYTNSGRLPLSNPRAKQLFTDLTTNAGLKKKLEAICEHDSAAADGTKRRPGIFGLWAKNTNYTKSASLFRQDITREFNNCKKRVINRPPSSPKKASSPDQTSNSPMNNSTSPTSEEIYAINPSLSTELTKLQQQSDIVIQCYDNARDYREIFAPITSEIIHEIISYSKNNPEAKQHYTLIINQDGRQLLSQPERDQQKKAARAKPRTLVQEDLQVYNINLERQVNNLAITIDPNSDHYLFKGQIHWVKALDTFGKDKHLKLSLCISHDYSSTKKVSATLVMKPSRKSRNKDTLNQGNVEFLGVSLAHSTTRKLFLELEKQQQRLPQTIENLYTTTAKRKTDAKFANVLYNPLNNKLSQIDVQDTQAFTRVTISYALPLLLEARQHTHPQAYRYYLEKYSKHQPDDYFEFFPRELHLYKFVQDKDFDQSRYLALKGNFTFVDNSGNVYRLCTTRAYSEFCIIYVPNEISLPSDYEFDSAFKDKLSYKLLFKDQFATNLIQTNPNWLNLVRSSTVVNGRELLSCKINTLPVLFPIAPYQLNSNVTTDSKLIALNMILQLGAEIGADDEWAREAIQNFANSKVYR
jgi:hypothetical protein